MFAVPVQEIAPIVSRSAEAAAAARQPRAAPVRGVAVPDPDLGAPFQRVSCGMLEAMPSKRRLASMSS